MDQKFIRFLVIFVGVSGCFSVLFSAWLNHGGQTLPAYTQATLKTALYYQLSHTLALLMVLVWVISQLKVKAPSKVLLASCTAFFLGIICFSGSIYITMFFNIAFVGKLAPFGGISLAVAWLLLSIEGKNNL